MSNRNSPKNPSTLFYSVIHQWYDVIFLPGCFSWWEVEKKSSFVMQLMFLYFFQLPLLWWSRKMLQLCVLIFIRKRGKWRRGELLHTRHPYLTLTCALQNSRNKARDLWSSIKKREPAANIIPPYLWPWAPEKQKKKRNVGWWCAFIKEVTVREDRALCFVRWPCLPQFRDNKQVTQLGQPCCATARMQLLV